MIINTPIIPDFKLESPEVVKVLDSIRYEIKKEGNEYLEFYWFAREYPRFYRYHIDNIKFRLRSISDLYELHKAEFVENNSSKDLKDCFELSASTIHSFQIYWDFEALLGALNAFLDLMARISGVAYEQQTPVSLNKISSKKELTGLVDIFRESKEKWINRLKDYRDCFVHYTPVDNRVYVTLIRQTDYWKMWCKIPVSPNIREVDGFEFSVDLDLLKYSIELYENLLALDREVATTIEELYKLGEFPKRINNLFYIGQRQRK
ncbi:MAG: hypothetical protein MI921_12915 [Cytophagales bacterium]|nr:hypothetical protein [Cytophagales bacterium]